MAKFTPACRPKEDRTDKKFEFYLEKEKLLPRKQYHTKPSFYYKLLVNEENNSLYWRDCQDEVHLEHFIEGWMKRDMPRMMNYCDLHFYDDDSCLYGVMKREIEYLVEKKNAQGRTSGAHDRFFVISYQNGFALAEHDTEGLLVQRDRYTVEPIRLLWFPTALGLESQKQN